MTSRGCLPLILKVVMTVFHGGLQVMVNSHWHQLTRPQRYQTIATRVRFLEQSGVGEDHIEFIVSPILNQADQYKSDVVIRWQPPHDSFIALNIDGSVVEHGRKAACGGVMLMENFLLLMWRVFILVQCLRLHGVLDSVELKLVKDGCPPTHPHPLHMLVENIHQIHRNSGLVV